MSEGTPDLANAGVEGERPGSGEGLVANGEDTASAEQGAEAAAAGRRPDVIPEGYTPISQLLPDDIFIMGYPRSGHTWFQILVAGVVYGVDPRFGPLELVNHLVPDVAFCKYYRR